MGNEWKYTEIRTEILNENRQIHCTQLAQRTLATTGVQENTQRRNHAITYSHWLKILLSAPTAWDFSPDLGNLGVDLGFVDFVMPFRYFYCHDIRRTDEWTTTYSEREFTFARNRYILSLLCLTPTTHGFPWDDLRKIFSGRELTFTFAICRCPSVCLFVVCHLSVCNVRTPYPGDWNFRQCFYAI